VGKCVEGPAVVGEVEGDNEGDVDGMALDGVVVGLEEGLEVEGDNVGAVDGMALDGVAVGLEEGLEGRKSEKERMRLMMSAHACMHGNLRVGPAVLGVPVGACPYRYIR